MLRITHCVVLLGSLLGTHAISFCQSRVPLQDVSDKRSPIRVSGHISFQDDPAQPTRHTYRIEASIENVSRKDVVLVVIHIRSRGTDPHWLEGDRSSDDRFFGPKDLQSGETENIPATNVEFGSSTPGRKFGTPEANWEFLQEYIGSDQAPVATARITFVQFADGSTWGDTAAGRDLLVYRREIFNELIRYQWVLDREGTSAFLNAYANRDTYLWFPLLYVLTTTCKAKPDSCIIEGLHSLVGAARRHQAEMNENWTAPDIR